MKRPFFLTQIEKAFRVNPVVALLGPRQCGKTTLAKSYIAHMRQDRKRPLTYFDLENPVDEARLKQAYQILSGLSGLVVIDEVQKVPDLFKTLRVLVDQQERRVRYLILGSASRDLIRQSSETLAGRISYLELTPFTAKEVGLARLKRLWHRGGFPKSFLAPDEKVSQSWRKEYVRTYLERDIPSLGFQTPAATLRRFWMMLVHYHGHIFNASEIGASMGMNHVTIRRYLDILTGTFMIRQLHPWLENIGKRQVRSPKILFRDSGIYHTLLGIRSEDDLLHHPKLGASWEGFALEEVIRQHYTPSEDVYFWGTHNQAELDLMVLDGPDRIGYEIKFTDAPRITRSMKVAMQDLKLKQLRVIYPGAHRFPLEEGIEAVGLQNLSEMTKHFR